MEILDISNNSPTSYWRGTLPTLLAESYEDAAFDAMRETGLPLATFPPSCPYPLAQVLDQGWLPPV